jgi:hypothetical protein
MIDQIIVVEPLIFTLIWNVHKPFETSMFLTRTTSISIYYKVFSNQTVFKSKDE